MPFTLTMPKLSPTMEEGMIVKWHKKEGEAVNEGDVLFEVATDKATVEHSALDDGHLRKILVNENQSAKVNQAVAIFTETADENIEGYAPDGIKKEEAPKAEVEGAVAEEKPAAKPAAVMAQAAFTPEEPLHDYTFEFPISPLEDRLLASPLARKLAKEHGIDLTSVKGSGPAGRIMSRDLSMAQGKTTVVFGKRELPQYPPGSYEEEPLTPMRKAIGEKLQASKSFIPHFYVQQDVTMDALIETREQLKRFDVKVTFNDFIVRACALALKQHPTINSGYNSANNTIIRFKTIDIAIAVSIPDGLITPIVRHADYKNLGQISVEVKKLALEAKDGKLSPEQYRGGSFSISNLGMYGIHDFRAVINPPQASILAIGGIRECPVVKNGQVVPGKKMMLSLSSDHRVIDGADAAQFIKTVQALLENPSTLLL